MPIIRDLERDGEHSFHYMVGLIEVASCAGLEETFGPAPHLRFLESTWPGATQEQLHEAIAGAPDGLRPEDMQRYLEHHLPPKVSLVLPDVLLDIERRFEEEGPFDCILGHSEGAIIAATFVAHSLKKRAEGKKVIVPKCAVFMNGATPHKADGKGWLLADECGQVISIPTCHIIACNNALANGAVALYHLCDGDVATMVDHGRGHTIPRDDKSCKLICRSIRDMMERTKDLAKVEGCLS